MIMDAMMRSCIVKIHEMVQQRLDVALGVESEVKSLREKMEGMKDYLEDADRKRVKDKAVQQWSARLKEVLYEVDDAIDACRMKGDQLFRSASSSSSPPQYDDKAVCCRVSCFGGPSQAPQPTHKVGMQLQKLSNRMEEIAKKRSAFALERMVLEVSHGGSDKQIGSPVVASELVGKANLDAANAMVEMVTREDNDGRGFLIFAITGAAGIGKTTMARKIYNDSRLSLNFKVRVWVRASRVSATELLKQVIKGAGGEYGPAQKKAELKEILRSAIAGKSFFLVLDDVPKSSAWEDCLRSPMEQPGTVGRILITSRNIGTPAESTHNMKELSPEDGWSLLSRDVFDAGGEEKEVEHFKVIGEQLVGRCNGLPLAIKAVAGVLRTKGRSIVEWDKIHQSSVWSMKELPSELQGPNSALYLSYLDLPPPLKQCFLYCSLFPEESELRRWELVRLWVAEGFVADKPTTANAPPSMIEDVAEDYYFQLMRRNFLHPIPHYYGKSKCTVHGLLRSLAVFLTQNEAFNGDASEIGKAISPKLRHLSVSNPEHNKTQGHFSIGEAKALRTFISLHRTPKLLDNVFLRLPYLRVLVLKGLEMETLPDDIGNLVHLRLLNLEDSKLQELPESIAKLSQLQVLDVRDCKSLHHLHPNITKLKSLRSLLVAGTPLTEMPTGIERLRSLNEIIAFVIGNNLEDLKPLSNLRVLHTVKLENAEPKGASVLADKIHLKELILKATLPKTDTGINKEKMELLLNELCPPTTIEVLQIGNYIGHVFPTWLSSPPRLTASLPNLVYLYITNCVACPRLPPVGQLPQLRYLEISGAVAVMSIDKEFLGSPAKMGKEEPSAAFPKLEVLKLRNMPNWEKWTLPEQHEESSRLWKRSKKVRGPAVFPCLHQLVVEDCPKLKSLPKELGQVFSLRDIFIIGQHKEGLKSMDNFPLLFHDKKLDSKSGMEVASDLQALQRLYLDDRPALK